MNTYYGLVSSFDDRGNVSAHIITKKADQMPDNTCVEGDKADIYTDWYETEREARAELEQIKYA